MLHCRLQQWKDEEIQIDLILVVFCCCEIKVVLCCPSSLIKKHQTFFFCVMADYVKTRFAGNMCYSFIHESCLWEIMRKFDYFVYSTHLYRRDKMVNHQLTS